MRKRSGKINACAFSFRFYTGSVRAVVADATACQRKGVSEVVDEATNHLCVTSRGGGVPHLSRFSDVTGWKFLAPVAPMLLLVL